MALASSVTFHAWAWPWRPIIKLRVVRMDAVCPLSRVDGFSEGEMCPSWLLWIPLAVVGFKNIINDKTALGQV